MNGQPPIAAKVICTAAIVAADVLGLILLWSHPTLGAGILVVTFVVTLVLSLFGLLYLLDLGRLRRRPRQE